MVTGADRPDTQAAIERLKGDGLGIAGLGEPVEVTPSHDGKVALVSFTMAGGQNDEANRAIVRQFRAELLPAVFGGLPDVRALVTGDAAFSVDVTQVYADGIPLIFGFVLGLSFLLMLVAFHSIVIPIKAIILNLLSTAAALRRAGGRLPERLVRRAARASRRAGSSRAGSRCSSSRSCSACRWTTTCSS